MFSSPFMLFPTFLETNYLKKMFVVLASEPVGGRSRVTELPCYELTFDLELTFARDELGH